MNFGTPQALSGACRIELRLGFLISNRCFIPTMDRDLSKEPLPERAVLRHQVSDYGLFR
jgi:hypothetical protein